MVRQGLLSVAHCIQFHLSDILWPSEAATGGVLWKKLLKISQYSQKNTFMPARDSGTGVFRWILWNFLRNTFFAEHLRTAASGPHKWIVKNGICGFVFYPNWSAFIYFCNMWNINHVWWKYSNISLFVNINSFRCSYMLDSSRNRLAVQSFS